MIVTPAITLMAFSYYMQQDDGLERKQINRTMRRQAKEHGYKWENIELLVKSRVEDIAMLMQSVTPLFDENGTPVAGLVDRNKFNRQSQVAKELIEAANYLATRR